MDDPISLFVESWAQELPKSAEMAKNAQFISRGFYRTARDYLDELEIVPVTFFHARLALRALARHYQERGAYWHRMARGALDGADPAGTR